MNPPTPSRPGLNGMPYATTRSEWQSKQMLTCLTRYSPRATRSGVASTLSVLAARWAGLRRERYETPIAAIAARASKKIPTTFSKVFMLFPGPIGVPGILRYGHGPGLPDRPPEHRDG